jgi:hypothetical protein
VESRPDKEAIQWELIAGSIEKPASEKSKFLKFFEVKK